MTRSFQRLVIYLLLCILVAMTAAATAAGLPLLV